MKLRALAVIFFVLTLNGCLADEIDAATSNFGKELTWVFLQINIPEEDDKIETYYYYGQISKNIYTKIKSNSLKSGFVNLANIRYWDKNDRIKLLSYGRGAQGIVFRIEDIRKMTHLMVEPQAGMDSDALDAAVAASEANSKTPLASPIKASKAAEIINPSADSDE
jgi:hypothetical protein